MVDAHCLSYLALNDPALMVDMPAPLTAATGMDALTHAIEAYVAKSHFPFTDGLALEAIGLVAKSLQKACEIRTCITPLEAGMVVQTQYGVSATPQE